MQNNSTVLQQYLTAKKTIKLSEADPKAILLILNKGLLLLGIRAERMPSDFELTYMVQMLRKDFYMLPIGELELAFELCAKDKLDEVSETYQNFSVLYLSRMMGAYARYIRNMNIPVEPIEPARQIKNKDISDDEIIQMSRENFERYKDWEHIFMGLKTFKILHDRGLINIDEISLEYIYNKTVSALTKIDKYTSHKDRKEVLNKLKDEGYMEIACRRMAVADYFEKNKLDKQIEKININLTT